LEKYLSIWIYCDAELTVLSLPEKLVPKYEATDSKIKCKAKGIKLKKKEKIRKRKIIKREKCDKTKKKKKSAFC
jgi:hypothetical protein